MSLKLEYKEAYAVLEVSAKARAALSRRLLQQLLWDRGIKKRDLAEEITEAINTSQFPSETAKFINNVRYLGNFAAHPLKTAAGQIASVKTEESRWCLGVLQLLFDRYFIQPAMVKRIQKAVKMRAPAAAKVAIVCKTVVMMVLVFSVAITYPKHPLYLRIHIR
jgi:hypothetical protein